MDYAAAAAWYAAALATILAAIQAVMWWRRRRLRVALRLLVIWRPQPDGSAVPRLHVEAINRSSRKLSLMQWRIVQPGLGLVLAGSPYEGRSEGPDLLEPDQLHGWTIAIPPDIVDLARPLYVEMLTAAGKAFQTEQITVQR
jgi:hypothetical protein